MKFLNTTTTTKAPTTTTNAPTPTTKAPTIVKTGPVLRVQDKRAREEIIQYRPPAGIMQATPLVSFMPELNKKSDLDQTQVFNRTQTIFPFNDTHVNRTTSFVPISSRYA